MKDKKLLKIRHY